MTPAETGTQERPIKSPVHTVRFVTPEREWTVEVADGESLLEAARRVEAPVNTLCNGIGSCIQCRVRVVEGEDRLSTPGALERDRLGNIFHITHERMGCQAKVFGDVVIEALPVRLPTKSRRDKGPRAPR